MVKALFKNQEFPCHHITRLEQDYLSMRVILVWLEEQTLAARIVVKVLYYLF